MKEIAIVKKIEEDRIEVECRPSVACASCKGGVCSAGKSRSILVRNVDRIPLGVGDLVEIFIPSSQAITAALLVFGVPLLLFVLFYIGAGHFVYQPTEGAKVTSGLVGLALGFASVLFLGKKSKHVPIVLRKFEESLNL